MGFNPLLKSVIDLSPVGATDILSHLGIIYFQLIGSLFNRKKG